MDTPTFSKTFTVSDLICDRFGRLTPSGLLRCIQEVSGLHSNLLGAGQEELDRLDLFWAVLRTRVQITRLPALGETFTVTTWPMPTTRSAYPRAAAAYDTQGNELFRCITVWVLMNRSTRALVVPGKSGVEVAGLLRGLELPMPAGLPAKALAQDRRRSVCFTDLDRNGHMNNTRYLDWIWDLLPGDFHLAHPPRDITVCYLSEAREGDALTVQWDFPEPDCLLVDIHRETDGGDQRIFSARLVL